MYSKIINKLKNNYLIINNLIYSYEKKVVT